MYRKYLKIIFLLILIFFLSFIALDQVYPLKINVDYSQVILDREGELLHAFLSDDDKWRMKTQLEEISPYLKKVITYKEDKYFYYHFGINPVAIVRAFINNLLQGKHTSGASTITMQVARLLEPKERSYLNKFIEMFRAMQLEWHYSKEEILQMYLNLVPYGGNIEGVKSASLIYFRQMPREMSLARVVTLSIIPNRPTSMVIGQNNSFILQERNRWLNKLNEDEMFPEDEINDALNESLHAWRHPVKQEAPHLSYRVSSRFPGMDIIKTTIDPEKQKKVQQLVYNYSKRLINKGITNSAVMVINNKDKSVEAYIGSADFFNDAHQGQVDGVKAVRSPGSTLKPFLYALAIDKGLVTPKLMLTDVPVNFAGYRPENYDREYRGKLTMEKALALSLNVPVVKMLEKTGMNYFVEKLIEADLKQIEKDKKKLGLSLVLGGCGVTLEELTNFYSVFANYGEFKNLTYINRDSSLASKQLFSPSSAYMITEILTKTDRPDLPSKYENSIHLPKIAWKTGTSYGRRDAWSVGYSKEYTVGVWVGNFSGEGVAEMYGAGYAAPLLFQVFNTLQYNTGKDWFTEPGSIDFRLVCTETGMLPDDLCTDKVMDYYIPAVSSNRKCDHLAKVFVNKNETTSYCRTCRPEAGVKIKTFYNHPVELLSFYDQEQIPYEKIPKHETTCTRIHKEGAPRITSPANNSEYLLISGESNKIMLSCRTESDVQEVFWYIDDVFFKKAGAEEDLFFQPGKGSVKISCTDDKGRNSDIFIEVEMM